MICSRSNIPDDHLALAAVADWPMFNRGFLTTVLDGALELTVSPHSNTGLRVLAALFFADVAQNYRTVLDDDERAALARKLYEAGLRQGDRGLATLMIERSREL